MIFKEPEYDLVIVGGGSAGMFGAARVSKLLPKEKKILLLEKTSSLGNKLCLSGNGQCNFTNACNMNEFKKHYGENGNFLKNALFNLSNDNLINLFKEMRFETVTRDDKKIFPKSLRAEDIKFLFLKFAEQYPVEIMLNSELKEINYSSEEILLNIINSGTNVKIKTNYLILCTGGASYPHTGSDGAIERLLAKFDILVKPFKPALAIPKIESVEKNEVSHYSLSCLSGITLQNVRLSIYKKQNSKELMLGEIKNNDINYQLLNFNNVSGDLLFTHTGLSGPLILDNSRYFEEGDKIRIYLTEFNNNNDIDTKILELLNKHPKRKIINILHLLGIPERIVDHLMQGVNVDIRAAELSKLERKYISKKLLFMEFLIVKFNNIDSAMCSRGGVDLSEIDKNTMMLKKMPNVFVAGECIDIDGDSGGYNIHAAFATMNLILKYLSGLMR